jgi:hypothetical protein
MTDFPWADWSYVITSITGTVAIAAAVFYFSMRERP